MAALSFSNFSVAPAVFGAAVAQSGSNVFQRPSQPIVMKMGLFDRFFKKSEGPSDEALFVDDPTIFNNRINDRKTLTRELQKQQGGATDAPKVEFAAKKKLPTVVAVGKLRAAPPPAESFGPTPRRRPGANLQGFKDMAKTIKF